MQRNRSSVAEHLNRSVLHIEVVHTYGCFPAPMPSYRIAVIGWWQRNVRGASTVLVSMASVSWMVNFRHRKRVHTVDQAKERTRETRRARSLRRQKTEKEISAPEASPRNRAPAFLIWLFQSFFFSCPPAPWTGVLCGLRGGVRSCWARLPFKKTHGPLFRFSSQPSQVDSRVRFFPPGPRIPCRASARLHSGSEPELASRSSSHQPIQHRVHAVRSPT